MPMEDMFADQMPNSIAVESGDTAWRCALCETVLEQPLEGEFLVAEARRWMILYYRYRDRRFRTVRYCPDCAERVVGEIPGVVNAVTRGGEDECNCGEDRERGGGEEEASLTVPF